MDIKDWARLGAKMRFEQIEVERNAILKAFPDLRSGRSGRKRVISAEGRRAMSEGMRRMWARRKKAATKHNMSEENRKKAAERMRAYWAAKRKSGK